MEKQVGYKYGCYNPRQVCYQTKRNRVAGAFDTNGTEIQRYNVKSSIC